jgi:hypothetical protein
MGTQPAFSTSEILATPPSPLEAEVATFTVVLRNSGPDDAGAVAVMVEWPLMGFFVDASGFDAPQIDHIERRIEDTIALARGAERRLHIRVLAPRDSGGDGLMLAYKAAHYASMAEYYDRKMITIDTRLPPGGVDIGGYRLNPASVAVLAWMMMAALLWLVVEAMARQTHRARARSRSGGIGSYVSPGAAVAAVMIAVGFWMMFGAMAWRDYQSLTHWPETTCTVLGGRLSAQTTTRTGTRPGTDTTNYVPVLGLRYVVDGNETFSSGYDTGSRLGIGGQGGRSEELDRWRVGAEVPCWYDADDPLDVVVMRGFGGAYLFALLPLPVFLLGGAGLRRVWPRPFGD